MSLVYREHKVAQYWPSSFYHYYFFIRVYGPRPSRGPLTRKKERGKNPAIFTEQFWLIKGLLCGFLMFTGYHR